MRIGKDALFPLFCFLSALFVSGCRHQDPSIDLLHGELRWMEDQLYMLEDELEETCSKLAQCQHVSGSCISCDSVDFPRPRIIQDRAWNPSTGPIPQQPIRPSIRPPSIRRPSSQPSAVQPTIRPPTKKQGERNKEEPAYREPSMPQIVLPPEATDAKEPVIPRLEPTPEDGSHQNPSDPPVERAPEPGSVDDANGRGNSGEDGSHSRNHLTMDAPDPEPELAIPPEGGLPVSDGGTSFEEFGGDSTSNPENPFSIRLQSHVATESIRAVDAHVTHIVIQCATFQPNARHHDLEILVEPRNADGDYLPLPGRVAVVILDQQQEGSAARIARWDRTAEDTAGLMAQDAKYRGIVLKLDWPDAPPESPRLVAYVRYYAVDGRKIEASQQLPTERPVTRSATASWAVAPTTNVDGHDGWQVVDGGPVVDDPQVSPAAWQVEETPSANPMRRETIANSGTPDRRIPSTTLPASTWAVPTSSRLLPPMPAGIQLDGGPQPAAKTARPEWRPHR